MSNERVQDPELLRREIAATRSDMDRTLAELEDRVSPTRIKERQTAKVRSRWDGVKTSVMGSVDDLQERGEGMGNQMQSTLHDAQEGMMHAPEQLESATRGNPLAAGLVAFGVGALAGSMMPVSGAERKVADELRDQFEEPLEQQLHRSGDEMRTELQEHAQEAMEETKQSVQEGAEHVRDDARTSGEQVQDQARDAAETVRSQH